TGGPTPNACFGVGPPTRRLVSMQTRRLAEAVLGQQVELHMRAARAEFLLVRFQAGPIGPIEGAPALGGSVDEVLRAYGERGAAAMAEFGEGVEPGRDALRPVEFVEPVGSVSGVAAQFHPPGEPREVLAEGGRIDEQ